jgi:hypothetical protein
MTGRRPTLRASFNGRQVEVACGSEALATGLATCLGPLLAGTPARDVILSLSCEEVQPSWVELRDRTGRTAHGLIDLVGHHMQKWVTDAFMRAHPDFLWLHAAGASLDGGAIVLAGPAGAGKSTLVVRLVDRGWRLLGDDALPVRVEDQSALPLPFSPGFRVPTGRPGADRHSVLERRKQIVVLPPGRVALEAAPIRAILLVEYSAAGEETLTPLSVVTAAYRLAAQCLHFGRGKPATIRALFGLAQAVPVFRFGYRDADSAATLLTRAWRRWSGQVPMPASVTPNARPE